MRKDKGRCVQINTNTNTNTNTPNISALDDKFNEKCEKSSFFVPKSIEDLKRITPKINIDRLEQLVRIWTDYERFNRTHFWINCGNSRILF